MEEKKCCAVINNQYYGCCNYKGNGTSKQVYSFDEVEIGTWVDGKTIYRKVITGTLAKDSVGSVKFANVSDLAIDCIINLYGNAKENNNVIQFTLQTSYNTPSGLNGAVNMFYDSTNGNIYYCFLNNNGTYSGSVAYVVIEYTMK